MSHFLEHFRTRLLCGKARDVRIPKSNRIHVLYVTLVQSGTSLDLTLLPDRCPNSELFTFVHVSSYCEFFARGNASRRGANIGVQAPGHERRGRQSACPNTTNKQPIAVPSVYSPSHQMRTSGTKLTSAGIITQSRNPSLMSLKKLTRVRVSLQPFGK